MAHVISDGEVVNRRPTLTPDWSRTKGRVIEHGQILIDGPTCGLRRQSLLAFDPVLPVRIGLDQAGIDRKAFSPDKTLADAAPQHRLEQAPQQIALTETAVSVLGESRMVRYVAVET